MKDKLLKWKKELIYKEFIEKINKMEKEDFIDNFINVYEDEFRVPNKYDIEISIKNRVGLTIEGLKKQFKLNIRNEKLNNLL